jgi:predicted peptidase
MTLTILLAATLVSSFSEEKFVSRTGGSMPYVLFVPSQYDGKTALPLVLWLHGGGVRGDDPKQILAFGDQNGPLFFARADNQRSHPAFVLAPQCPRDRYWSDPEGETREMKIALQILDDVRRRYRVDARRLYVAGISMGGYGVWDVIVRHPELFAAALPMCGGGDPTRAGGIRTPVWAFHGREDELVSVQESRRMIEAMRAAGLRPRYSEYPGVEHNVWHRAFQEPDLLDWLFKQRR